jgi:hypothetical protein
MKYRLALFLLLACYCLSNVRAQSDTQGRSMGGENLKGIKAVYIAVEDVDASIAATSLTKSQLLSDARLRLQKGGIRLATHEEWLNEDNIGDLNLAVILLKAPDKLAGVDNSSRLVVYNIQLDLQEVARLDRAPGKHIMATTYAVSNQIGLIGADAVARLSKTVGDSIDVFVKDYLAANPK